MKIIETNLQFTNFLSERPDTNMIVIHHTGSVSDLDFSAEQIHQIHKQQGYSGIGYHFVIRKSGAIERGRPVYALGAHAYGENWHTIGVHLSGDFNTAQPTSAQIEAAAQLCASLSQDYNLPLDRAHIKGHCELMATSCPGKNLVAQLDTISGKANWYRWHGVKPDVIDKPPINDNQLSEHFSKSEFWCRGQEQGTCNCRHSLVISPTLIELLEKLRVKIGVPININSGYRCPDHNAAIGGVPNSQHSKGTAADLAVPYQLTFEQFKKAVFDFPFDGIGLYPYDNFIHVDVRDGARGHYYLW